MHDIKLYELGPTRSARCRWTLLEADLEFESLGNDPKIIGSDDLKKIHPLGKLPAAIINGKPIFESAAIATAIADLVPEKELVAKPGTWSRTLHDQWVAFALTELEPWAWTTEINTLDFVLSKDKQVPAIIPQCEALYKKSAAALNSELSKTPFLIEERFTVTDIIVGYSFNFGQEFGWLKGFPHLLAYLDRLLDRPHCTLLPFD